MRQTGEQPHRIDGMALTPQQAYKIASIVGPEAAASMTADNPFLLNTPRAREYQAMIQAGDKTLAAELAREVPHSMAYSALQFAIGQGDKIDISKLPQELREEVMLRDGPALQSQQEAREAQILADMAAQADALAKANGRDPDAPKQYRNWQEQQVAERRHLEQLEAAARKQVGAV